MHSDAVTKSSSDLLPSSVDPVASLPPDLFRELYHSYDQTIQFFQISGNTFTYNFESISLNVLNQYLIQMF